jgi:predicted amidophosphoribosyltransferase
MILLSSVRRQHMFASLINGVTAPFGRKRCPECGHKVRQAYCDVCGYRLVEEARDKYLYRR